MSDLLTELRAAATAIEAASVAEDVFGALHGSKESQNEQLVNLFRQLVRTVHPDKHPGATDSDKESAATAFGKLTAFRDEAEQKIEAGTYGLRKARVERDTPISPTIIQVRNKKYILGRIISEGDIADVYGGTIQDDPKNVELAFKLVRSVADNDLMDREAEILKELYPKDQADEQFYRYLPKLLDNFRLRGTSGSMRAVNLFPRALGFYSLAQILREYPNGLDFRDVVWMFKRLLVAIGFAHEQGFVHGAVVPAHVLVHPIQHGAKLVDWHYSVTTDDGDRVPAISKSWKVFYAPEILAKEQVRPATDIYMAAKCAVALLGGDADSGKMPDTVPSFIQSFLTSCLVRSPARRPDDAWKLHEEFDELLKRTVGKPKYRALAMPAKSAS